MGRRRESRTACCSRSAPQVFMQTNEQLGRIAKCSYFVERRQDAAACLHKDVQRHHKQFQEEVLAAAPGEEKREAQAALREFRNAQTRAYYRYSCLQAVAFWLCGV